MCPCRVHTCGEGEDGGGVAVGGEAEAGKHVLWEGALQELRAEVAEDNVGEGALVFLPFLPPGRNRDEFGNFLP